MPVILCARTWLACLVVLTAAAAAAAQPAPSLIAAMSAVAEDRLSSVEAAAELMPPGDYGLVPAAGARPFGRLVAHVADSNRAFCSAIAGARQPVGTEVETGVHGKAALLDALKAANAACRAALSTLTDAMLPAPRAFGGGALIDGTTIAVRDLPAGMLVMLLASHTEREYGKLTIYLRQKGLVPPTSQPRSR
ncbi:MAG: DinB family protein [Vicinamibacterales bacterium]